MLPSPKENKPKILRHVDLPILKPYLNETSPSATRMGAFISVKSNPCPTGDDILAHPDSTINIKTIRAVWIFFSFLKLPMGVDYFLFKTV
jgi:hypothetical protein